MYKYSVTKIQIPNSVITIKGGAFRWYKELLSINIPNSVTTIRSGAFDFCLKLQSIIIPDSITTIQSSTFLDCESLQSIVLPNNLISIGNKVFWECYKLSSITLPDSLTTIGEFAFYRCTELKYVSIPNSVTNIQANAFYNCVDLEFINIPTGVTTIDQGKFFNCKSLKSIVIPENVTKISFIAFPNCYNLQCFQIKSQSCEIVRGAFLNTSYENKTNPSEFDQKCKNNIYTNCNNNSSDYHDIDSDQCVLEMFVKHYVIKNGIKYYYEQCPQELQFTIDKIKQCVDQCPINYVEKDDKCIINPCLNQSNFYVDEYKDDSKNCIQKCDTVWRYQKENNKYIKICFTNNDNCSYVEGFTKQADKQCVTKCDNAIGYIQPEDINNNTCVILCLIGCAKYVYYHDEINGNICTNKSTCKSFNESYKLYNIKTKECRPICDNNDKTSTIDYVWQYDNEFYFDNICTTKTTCQALGGKQYGKYKLVYKSRQCVENCTFRDDYGNILPAVWYVDYGSYENRCINLLNVYVTYYKRMY